MLRNKMRETSRSRQFGCSIPTSGDRWRWCVRRWNGWMLSTIVLWTVLVAWSTAEPSPGPGPRHGRLLETEQTLALRVMDTEETCSEVRIMLARKIKTGGETTEATDNDEASSSSPPQQLGVCSRDSSCCTGQMESMLMRKSDAEFKRMVGDKMKNIKQTFVTWTAKFDTFFQSLIERSKRSLYDLFHSSHRVFIEHNSRIFVQLFNDLRSHYKSDEMNLEDALDRFFTALFQRRFSHLNADLELTDDYLQCVAEHMDLIRPFNDVPQRLQSEIRRSFLVARAFVQGLSQGKEIVIIMAKLSPDEDCSKSMTRMLFCQLCQGHLSVKPCSDVCRTTISRCLSQSIEIQDEWTNYLRDLLRLTDRLSDPLNIESVVRRLYVGISEAITNYEDNSTNVATLVSQDCGSPPPKTRPRRATRSDDYSTETISESIPSSTTFRNSSYTGSSSSSSSSNTSSTFSIVSTSSSSSSSSPSSSDSSNSSLFSTMRPRSGQRQQQRNQRQRQQHGQQQREGQQPEQQEGQEQTSKQHQREEQPGQTKQPREQRRQRERLQEEQQRQQQQEELARQQQLYDEQQRQQLLHQTQESNQYTEQPTVELQGQPLSFQPRESDQYIEQPPVEEQRQRHRLQQRQPTGSQQNRNQRERGQPRQREEVEEQRRQQHRPAGASEETLSELEQNLRDVRRKLDAVRSFWEGLPKSICGDIVIAEPGNESICWNGIDLTRGEGVSIDSGYTRRPTQLTSIVRQQILKLRVASDKLRQAYNGWSENDLDGSGNGLDFGSGTEIETAPPPVEEIRTNAPEVAATSTESSSSATKAIRRLTSGAFRPNRDAIFVPLLLSIFLIASKWLPCFFDTLCR